MLRQRGGPLGLVARLVGVEEGVQRRLRVDDDLLAAGQVDDQVGPQRAVVAPQRALLAEVAAVDHAGQLDDPLQLQLAPAAARLRLAQGGAEAGRLAAQPLLRGDELAQLLLQRAPLNGAVAVERSELLVGPPQRLADRRDQLLHPLRPPLGRRARSAAASSGGAAEQETDEEARERTCR